MKIAFLFPGQGSQCTGMGKDIYEKYEEARKVYTRANEILGMDTEKLCFESSEEELSKTENAQIAIALNSLATLEVIKAKGIEAEMTAGLSLGEYVALTYAQYLDLGKCLKLLQKRGYYMGNYIPNEEYSMAAVMGLETQKIEEVCTKIKEKGKFVVPANYNYTNQTVISGNLEAVEEAMTELKEIGAIKIVKLKTSGPFHTEKLEKARELYTKELQNVEIHNPNIEISNQNIKASISNVETASQKTKIEVIKNIDGTLYTEKDDIREILSKHIISPVRFDKTIKAMKERGIDTFIEIGPGKSITGFIKKEIKDPEIKCYTTQNVEQLEEMISELAKEK